MWTLPVAGTCLSENSAVASVGATRPTAPSAHFKALLLPMTCSNLRSQWQCSNAPSLLTFPISPPFRQARKSSTHMLGKSFLQSLIRLRGHPGSDATNA